MKRRIRNQIRAVAAERRRLANLIGPANAVIQLSMKTAVSIPDALFVKAERLARRMKKSRSQLFSNALVEYVARHAPDHVTEAMDDVCAEIGSETDQFGSAASRRILERSEW